MDFINFALEFNEISTLGKEIKIYYYSQKWFCTFTFWEMSDSKEPEFPILIQKWFHGDKNVFTLNNKNAFQEDAYRPLQ